MKLRRVAFVSIVLLLSTVASAQDVIKKEGMANEAMSGGSMSKAPMEKDGMMKDDIKDAPMEKGAMKKDSMEKIANKETPHEKGWDEG